MNPSRLEKRNGKMVEPTITYATVSFATTYATVATTTFAAVSVATANARYSYLELSGKGPSLSAETGANNGEMPAQ